MCPIEEKFKPKKRKRFTQPVDAELDSHSQSVKKEKSTLSLPDKQHSHLRAIVQQFGGGRPHGDTWMCSCPAHKDDKASLSVSAGKNGGVVVNCFAGCPTSAVLECVGLNLSNLMSDPAPFQVRVYTYTDEHKNFKYQVVKMFPKGFFIRKAGPKGSWITKSVFKGLKKVLYKLPELYSAKIENEVDPSLVFICEGEKDVENLLKLGFRATTNVCGANDPWRQDYTDCLSRFKRVVILNDNDQAGKERGESVANAITSANHAGQVVSILDLPDLPDKGDVSDWLENGGTARELLALARKAPKYIRKKEKSITKSSATDAEDGNPDAPTIQGFARSLADIAKELRGLEFLIPGWVPLGMLTGIIAEPGIGKSALALWIARSIVMGVDWFTGSPGPEPGNVLWIPTENDLAITIKRASDWGIPLDRFMVPDFGEAIDLANEEHVGALEVIAEKNHCRAMFLDSLRGSHDGDENSSAISKILKGLAGIAERQRCGSLVVHHTRKLGSDEDISANASRGSNAILAMFRAQIGIDRPDLESPYRRIRMLKENLGLAPDPIGFQFTEKGLEFGPAPVRPDRSRKGIAQAWLAARLAKGPTQASEIIAQAQAAGVKLRTLEAAKAELGVRAVKRGSHWLWEL